MRTISASVAVLVVAAGLAGCAAPDLALPPLTSLEGRACADAPDFSKAMTLAVDAKDKKVTNLVVDGTAPCFKDERGASSYAVFALPDLTMQYTVQIDSTPAGNALFAPRILLYGKDGTLKRSFMEKQITYRDKALSAVFRYHPDEAYIVVASDPVVCGNRDTRINDNTQTAMVCGAYGCFNWNSGKEAVHTQTLSHNGRIAVTMIPIPKAK